MEQPASLGSHIPSTHPGRCVSICSHFHTFTHLLTSLQRFLFFFLSANTLSISHSLSIKLTYGTQQVSMNTELPSPYYEILAAHIYHCETCVKVV